MENRDVLSSIPPAALVELVNSQLIPVMDGLLAMGDHVDKIYAVSEYMGNKKQLAAGEIKVLSEELKKSVDNIEKSYSDMFLLLMGSFLRMAPEDIRTQIIANMKKRK